MHPFHHVSFDDWIKTIEQYTHAGDTYFKEHDSAAFDSMPAVWRKMTVDTRRHLLQAIDEMQEQASTHEMLWTVANAKQLLKFAPLSPLNNLRMSYFYAKENPGVIDQ
eukprot:10085689-Ditylum_brightwellii.AAC.1